MNRRALLIAGAGLVLAPRAWAQGGADLGYLLAVEQLQVDVYSRARALPLTGRAAALAGRFHNHEVEHLARLTDAINARATTVNAPAFSNQDGFLRAAQRVEGLAVSAYNGAIPAIRDRGLRAELAAIAQVEARHSAAIRDLRGADPAPRSFDPGAQQERVERALANF